MLGLWSEIAKAGRWGRALLVVVVVAAVAIVVVDDASARGVIDMRQVRWWANHDARRACKAFEITIEFGVKLRKCESWSGYPCYRQSLTRPEVGYCYGEILLDDARGYAVTCNKVLRYRRPARGGIRRVRTPPWGCSRSDGPTAVRHG